MILHYFARTQHLVHEPGRKPVQGQHPRYVGRRWVSADDGNGGGYVTTAEGQKFDTDNLSPQQTLKFRRIVNDGSLWCADEATAAWHGIPFTPVKFNAELARFELIAAPPAPAAPEGPAPQPEPEPAAAPEKTTKKAQKAGGNA